MKMGHIKNYLAYFFLATFISLKVAALHVFSHGDNNVKHCEVCELVSFHTSFPAVIDGFHESHDPGVVNGLSRLPILGYDVEHCVTTGFFKCFSRPPPTQ